MSENEDFCEMERYLIVSDTHGRTGELKKVLGRFERLDGLIHLGDLEAPPLSLERLGAMAGCPVTVVRGNCDGDLTLPLCRVVRLGRYQAFLTHGHRYGVRGGLADLVRTARENDAQFAFYGHTHVGFLDTIDGITVCNPGSLSLPHDGQKSYVYVEVDATGEVHLSRGIV